MDIELATESLKNGFLFILQGAPLSIAITATALVCGFILAILLTAIFTLFPKRLIAIISRGFILFFTGTPLLVQIFLIYYGPGQFDWIRETPKIWYFFSNAWFCAALALSLNSAAYTTQIFNGAIRNISSKQWEACYALGMSRFEAFKILILLALRRALPSYSNEIVLVFKGTSLVSTIALLDIMGRVSTLVGITYDQLTYYLMAALIYIMINGVLIALAKTIEHYALAFERT